MRWPWIAVSLLVVSCKQTSVVYLDYMATTPCDHRVVKTMLPYFTRHFGNPHSSHLHGHEAHQAIEQARAEVRSLIGAKRRCRLLFTSGATESNNLFFWAVAQSVASGNKRHIISFPTEHKSVLEALHRLEDLGFSVSYLPVRSDGSLDMGAFAQALTDQTFLLSCMAVNNETGMINPLAAIGKLCKERGIFFHVDGAQGVGKIPIHVDDMGIDALSISGHKIYGPKGIGALYLSESLYQKIKSFPLVQGGGQEFGLRSGTNPTPLCIGLGKACMLAQSEMPAERERILCLRTYLYEKLQQAFPELTLNHDLSQSIPGALSVRIPKHGMFGKIKNPGLSYSSGSACSSGKPSHVMKAMGIDESKFHILRLSIGRYTTRGEIDAAVEALVREYADAQ